METEMASFENEAYLYIQNGETRRITVKQFLDDNDICNPTWRKASYEQKIIYCNQLIKDMDDKKDFDFCTCLKIVVKNRYSKIA